MNLKRGNIAAALLVILVVLASVTALTYTPFTEDEVHTDYGVIFSEVMSGISRSYFESHQESMKSGLYQHDGVWYFNAKGGELDESVITENITRALRENIARTSFSDEKADIEISNLNELELSIEEEGIKITTNGVQVNISLDDEERHISIDDEYMIPSDLKNTIESANTWLKCDAGGLNDLFKERNEEKACQFSNCCCGEMSNVGGELESLTIEYGMSPEEVKSIISESMNTLNGLMAGAETCEEAREEEQELKDDYRCEIVEERSSIETRTGFHATETGSQQSMCQNNPTICELESTGSEGDLRDWDLNQDPGASPEEVLEGEPEQSDELGNYKLVENINEVPETEDEGRTYYYRAGLERKAAGNVEISCRDSDTTSFDYNELRFNIKFRNQYLCDLPDEEADDEEKWGEDIPDICIGEIGGNGDNGDTGNGDGGGEGNGNDNDDDNDNGNGDENGDENGNGDEPDEPVECIEDQHVGLECEKEWDGHEDCMPSEFVCKEAGDDFECQSEGEVDPNRECGGDNSCRVCGDDGLCETPADPGTNCGEDTCIEYQCTGDLGECAAELEDPDDEYLAATPGESCGNEGCVEYQCTDDPGVCASELDDPEGYFEGIDDNCKGEDVCDGYCVADDPALDDFGTCSYDNVDGDSCTATGYYQECSVELGGTCIQDSCEKDEGEDADDECTECCEVDNAYICASDCLEVT